MNKDDYIKNLENELSDSLESTHALALSEIGRVKALLEREYEKEIKDQIDFLKNMTTMAGVVAPFSLILLSDQALGIQKNFLLLGFVTLIVTILIALLSSKETLKRIYEDTHNLAFNHIIARISVSKINDVNSSLSDRLDASHEVMRSLFDIDYKFSDLGRTNKLAEMRSKITSNNNLAVAFFSLGLVFIISSVIFSIFVDFLSWFLLSY